MTSSDRGRRSEPEPPPTGSPGPPYFHDNRPLPFVLRVAAEWMDIEEAIDVDDRALFFRDRASLTGEVLATSGGADVEFSDIGVPR
jgi:hypothetical protein